MQDGGTSCIKASKTTLLFSNIRHGGLGSPLPPARLCVKALQSVAGLPIA